MFSKDRDAHRQLSTHKGAVQPHYRIPKRDATYQWKRLGWVAVGLLLGAVVAGQMFYGAAT